MPFPLLFIAVAAVAGTGGVVAAVDGLDSMSRAKDIGNEAKSRHEAAVAALEERRKVTQTWIEAHTRNKQAIVKGSLSRALACFEALRKRKNKLDPINSVYSVGMFAFDSHEPDLSMRTKSLNELLAISLASTYIGPLSLLFPTLGPVIIPALAPALIIVGFTMSARGDEALAKARSYSKEVDEHVVSLEAMKVTLSAIEQRIEEIEAVMGGFSRCLDALISRINPDTYDSEADHKNYLKKSIELTKEFTTILRAPILTHDFKISNESANLTLKYRNLLENGYV